MHDSEVNTSKHKMTEGQLHKFFDWFKTEIPQGIDKTKLQKTGDSHTTKTQIADSNAKNTHSHHSNAIDTQTAESNVKSTHTECDRNATNTLTSEAIERKVITNRRRRKRDCLTKTDLIMAEMEMNIFWEKGTQKIDSEIDELKNKHLFLRLERHREHMKTATQEMNEARTKPKIKHLRRRKALAVLKSHLEIEERESQLREKDELNETPKTVSLRMHPETGLLQRYQKTGELQEDQKSEVLENQIKTEVPQRPKNTGALQKTNILHGQQKSKEMPRQQKTGVLQKQEKTEVLSKNHEETKTLQSHRQGNNEKGFFQRHLDMQAQLHPVTEDLEGHKGTCVLQKNVKIGVRQKYPLSKNLQVHSIIEKLERQQKKKMEMERIQKQREEEMIKTNQEIKEMIKINRAKLVQRYQEKKMVQRYRKEPMIQRQQETGMLKRNQEIIEIVQKNREKQIEEQRNRDKDKLLEDSYTLKDSRSLQSNIMRGMDVQNTEDNKLPISNKANTSDLHEVKKNTEAKPSKLILSERQRLLNKTKKSDNAIAAIEAEINEWKKALTLDSVSDDTLAFGNNQAYFDTDTLFDTLGSGVTPTSCDTLASGDVTSDLDVKTGKGKQIMSPGKKQDDQKAKADQATTDKEADSRDCLTTISADSDQTSNEVLVDKCPCRLEDIELMYDDITQLLVRQSQEELQGISFIQEASRMLDQQINRLSEGLRKKRRRKGLKTARTKQEIE